MTLHAVHPFSLDDLRARVAREAGPFDVDDHGDHRLNPTIGDLIAKPVLRSAAVLVPVVQREDGPQVILTLRTAHLTSHAGQVAFPGGRIDPEDETAVHAALRETHEEIGIAPGLVEVIGRMPDYLTGSGYRIVPVFGMNLGTVGFLMNRYHGASGLMERLAEAKRMPVAPLKMEVVTQAGERSCAYAINEVSLLRETRQTAKIEISVNGKVRVPELAGDGVTRAYVNNGGDIALHLESGESLTCALATRPGMPDRTTIRAADPVRGIATSGWHGRSLSLGIADAVTVLARTAAMADAAATMIANAVDLPGHPAISRRPAQEIQADSDLGDRPVTVGLDGLSPAEIDAALAGGLAAARAFRANALIEAAALFLHPEIRTLGYPFLKEPGHA